MRRMALAVIFGSIVVIGVGYASAFLPGGPPQPLVLGFAVAISALISSLMALGALRRGKLPRVLALIFGATFLTLTAGFYLALSERAPAGDQLWLGLPRGAAIILYIIGLLPLLVLPIAYALTFDETDG